jgi:tripartite-type tricarboxylate transporter receptor subunit TctC
MKLPRRNFLHLAVGAVALLATSRIAWAQAYPTRPVRLIVPIAPGGASDITARLIVLRFPLHSRSRRILHLEPIG